MIEMMAAWKIGRILRGAPNLPMRIGLVLLLVIGPTGCGNAPERESADFERAIAETEQMQRRAAEVLRNHGDADSLAAAALFLARQAPDDALTLVARATTAAPERPELVFLHAQICARSDGCDPVPFEARLRQLDPANGIGWFGALDRAYAVADDAALDSALVAASRSERVDSYYTTLATRSIVAATSAGALSLTDAIEAVMAEVAGFGLPRYVSAAKGCGTERLERPGLEEACRSLAASMMVGDTVISELIGVAIAKRAWPVDSPEWIAATEAKRVYGYRSRALSDTEAQEWDETKSAAWLKLVGQHRREQDLLVAQLIALGIDPMPPADWTDKQSASPPSP